MKLYTGILGALNFKQIEKELFYYMSHSSQIKNIGINDQVYRIKTNFNDSYTLEPIYFDVLAEKIDSYTVAKHNLSIQFKNNVEKYTFGSDCFFDYNEALEECDFRKEFLKPLIEIKNNDILIRKCTVNFKKYILREIVKKSIGESTIYVVGDNELELETFLEVCGKLLKVCIKTSGKGIKDLANIVDTEIILNTVKIYQKLDDDFLIKNFGDNYAKYRRFN